MVEQVIQTAAKNIMKAAGIYGIARHAYLYARFVSDFRRFKKLADGGNDRPIPTWSQRLPYLYDKTGNTGFDRHYVYHTAWAARVLEKTRPELHVDIASSLYFVGILSAFIPIRHYDYRQADISLSNLESRQGNLLDLPFENESLKSISCMHVVEHVGLGRYGDSLDPDADIAAMAELERVVARGGSLRGYIPGMKSSDDFPDFHSRNMHLFQMIQKGEAPGPSRRMYPNPRRPGADASGS